MCEQLRSKTIDLVMNDVNDAFEYAQYYQIIGNSQNPNDAVGRPLVHRSALQQTTGRLWGGGEYKLKTLQEDVLPAFAVSVRLTGNIAKTCLRKLRGTHLISILD